jgi:hypothetical protein
MGIENKRKRKIPGIRIKGNKVIFNQAATKILGVTEDSNLNRITYRVLGKKLTMHLMHDPDAPRGWVIGGSLEVDAKQLLKSGHLTLNRYGLHHDGIDPFILLW